jgi:hypothetical protein
MPDHTLNTTPEPPEVAAEIVEPASPETASSPIEDALAARQAPFLSGPLKLAIGAAAAALIVIAGVLLLPRPRPDMPGPAIGPPAPEQAEAPPAVEAAEDFDPPDAGKILNTLPDAKPLAQDLDPSAAQPGRGLPEPPPVTPAGVPVGANDALQRAAKDALKALKPETAPRTERGSEVGAGRTEEQSAAPSAAEHVLARLEAEAQAAAAAEASGGAASTIAPAAASPAPPIATPTAVAEAAAPSDQQPGPDLTAPIAALSAESERLAAEAAAEKARADRFAAENESLRVQLAAARAAQDLQSKSAAAALSLILLARAIEDGRPFTAELAAVGEGGDAAALGALEALAAVGAPTIDQLRAEFPTAARQALAAEARARSPGLLGWLAGGLSTLVSVRPATPQPGAGAAAVISRIEARLAARDIEGALAEARSLNGAVRPPLNPWIERAALTVRARESLAALAAQASAPIRDPEPL